MFRVVRRCHHHSNHISAQFLTTQGREEAYAVQYTVEDVRTEEREPSEGGSCSNNRRCSRRAEACCAVAERDTIWLGMSPSWGVHGGGEAGRGTSRDEETVEGTTARLGAVALSRSSRSHPSIHSEYSTTATTATTAYIPPADPMAATLPKAPVPDNFIGPSPPSPPSLLSNPRISQRSKRPATTQSVNPG